MIPKNFTLVNSFFRKFWGFFYELIFKVNATPKRKNIAFTLTKKTVAFNLTINPFYEFANMLTRAS